MISICLFADTSVDDEGKSNFTLIAGRAWSASPAVDEAAQIEKENTQIVRIMAANAAGLCQPRRYEEMLALNKKDDDTQVKLHQQCDTNQTQKTTWRSTVHKQQDRLSTVYGHTGAARNTIITWQPVFAQQML
jgi:hypothetical protein